jgi:hypothetical protein
MFYEIEIVNGAMILLDAEGSSYERHDLAGLRDGKRTIREWATRYLLNIGECYRRLDEYYRAQQRPQ